MPARCSTSAAPRIRPPPPAADAQRARLPDRQPDQARDDHERHEHLHPVDAAPASSRSSSDGLTCRTSSSGTSENSSDTSRPMPNPCSTAGPVSAVVDVDAGVAAAARSTESRDRERRQQHAKHAAGEAERDDLGHVDGQQLRRPPADALQDRDAPDLLLHEHARDARHADAAENHDHQADEAQVVSARAKSSPMSSSVAL